MFLYHMLILAGFVLTSSIALNAVRHVPARNVF